MNKNKITNDKKHVIRQGKTYKDCMYFEDSWVTGNVEFMDLLLSAESLKKIYDKMHTWIVFDEDIKSGKADEIFKKYHAEILGNLEFEKMYLERLIKQLKTQGDVQPVIKRATEKLSDDTWKLFRSKEWM